MILLQKLYSSHLVIHSGPCVMENGNVPVEQIFSSIVDASLSLLKLLSVGLALPLGAGVLPIMAYMGRLHPKGVPFSGSRYMKG